MESLIRHTNRRRRPKVNRERALAIRVDYQAGMTWKQLEAKYDVSPPVLSSILKGSHCSIREAA